MKIEQAMPVNSGLKLDLISLSQDSNFKILGNAVSNVESNLIIYENAYNFKNVS